MSSNGGDLLKGFVAGSLVGLVAGLLFAPKSGKELREDIKNESDDLLNKAKVELDKLKDDLNDLQTKFGRKFGKGKYEQPSSEEKAFEAELNSTDEEEAKASETGKRSGKAK
jgi:gas vesicle protein